MVLSPSEYDPSGSTFKVTWNLSKCWMTQGTIASNKRWTGTVPAVKDSNNFKGNNVTFAYNTSKHKDDTCRSTPDCPSYERLSVGEAEVWETPHLCNS